MLHQYDQAPGNIHWYASTMQNIMETICCNFLIDLKYILQLCSNRQSLYSLKYCYIMCIRELCICCESQSKEIKLNALQYLVIVEQVQSFERASKKRKNDRNFFRYCLRIRYMNDYKKRL